MTAGRHIVFIAWRDLANSDAGGSELLVDRLAHGMTERGNRVTLLCGGQVGERPYEVRRSGGTFTQFATAPLAFRRHLRDCDLVVEVCNGMPFLAPLWTSRPVVCLVNHVHTELWPLRFPRPICSFGRIAESTVMPWAHRRNLFLTVSASTFASLQDIGVSTERIRLICNGVEPGPPPAPRSPEPMFLAFGRLAEYKRIDLLLRLWERVRHVTGGRLVIAGDGPERARLENLAGPGVEFTGRVPEAEKHRLMSAAWLLLHPASIEGWGIVVSEAAVRGTPAIGFSVPGLRDSIVHNETGVLVRTESEFASAWASLAIDDRKRAAMGLAARERARQQHWSAAVDGFSLVADEALARARVADQARPAIAVDDAAASGAAIGYLPQPSGAAPSGAGMNAPVLAAAGNPLHDFYSDPAVPASSGPDRARRQAEMLAQVLARAPGQARILDVGCGDGFATGVAAARLPGHRFAGLDWSAPSLRLARDRGVTVLQAGLDTGLPIRSASIDVVIMSEVIEHLVDTDSAIEEAHRVLKPGGSLLLSTPNLAAWYNRGLLAIGVQPVFSEVSLRSVFGRPGSQVAGHLHMFTRRALVEFLAAYGLAVVQVRGARYHDVPAALRPLDRLFCYWPSAASILLVQARKAC